MIDDDELHKAIGRIARTPDGHLLYRWAQKRLTAVLQSHDPGALSADNGERSLASKLMGLMAEGIDASDGQSDSSTGRASERPVVFVRRAPVAVSGTRGPGRRVTLDTHVPGFDTDAS